MSVAEQRQHVSKRHTAKRRRRVAPKELHILHILSEYKSVLKLLKSLRDEIDESKRLLQQQVRSIFGKMICLTFVLVSRRPIDKARGFLSTL